MDSTTSVKTVIKTLAREMKDNKLFKESTPADEEAKKREQENADGTKLIVFNQLPILGYLVYINYKQSSKKKIDLEEEER